MNIHQTFVAFVEAEVLPRLQQKPQHDRLDGWAESKGSWEVFGTCVSTSCKSWNTCGRRGAGKRATFTSTSTSSMGWCGVAHAARRTLRS